MAASIWRGRITFGLVSIPVRLVKAARRERTKFRRVQRVAPADSAPNDEMDEPDEPEAPAPSPKVVNFPASPQIKPLSVAASPQPEVSSGEVVRVRNAPVNALTEKPVRPAETLKGYEVSKDEFVVLSPGEVAALRPSTSSELEITDFVRLEDIDPVYYEVSYYVVPETGGEKAYNLLFETLKQTARAGMGSLAMHGREHVALIRAGREALVLHSLFYGNEVGRAAYRVPADAANEKELQLAKMLVGALEAKFEPEKWNDRYEERLKALIESRTPVASAGVPVPGRAAERPVPDIMEALRKSLEMARKPVSSERPPSKSKGTNRKAK